MQLEMGCRYGKYWDVVEHELRKVSLLVLILRMQGPLVQVFIKMSRCECKLLKFY